MNEWRKADMKECSTKPMNLVRWRSLGTGSSTPPPVYPPNAGSRGWTHNCTALGSGSPAWSLTVVVTYYFPTLTGRLSCFQEEIKGSVFCVLFPHLSLPLSLKLAHTSLKEFTTCYWNHLFTNVFYFLEGNYWFTHLHWMPSLPFQGIGLHIASGT